MTLDYGRPPRIFRLMRHQDDSGVSGTGLVAWGIEYPDGNAAIRWNTDTASTATYQSVEDVVKIHGHGGHTVLEWGTGDLVP